MLTTFDKIKAISCGFLLSFACFAMLTHNACAEEGCVTAKCHKGMLKSKNIHPVVEPCDSCHRSVALPHPQKKTKTFKLLQDMPALCYQCHPSFSNEKHIHAPVQSGMCTACHNPHDSAQPKLLTQPAESLCKSCHPDKIEFKFVHGPAATGDCISCHNPHASKNKALVLKDGPELCFTCHFDMQAETKKKVPHPAMDGGCTSCHNPHGSSVKKFFPASGAALCYQCHPQIESKMKEAKLVHAPLKSEKGCASCHAPHSSDAPKLLMKSGKELCLDCHKDFMKKTPKYFHAPLKEGQCTPCHDPHGTPYDKLLVNKFSPDFYVSYTDTSFQLCFGCHNRDMLRNPATTYATAFRDGNKNLHYLHVNRKDRGKSCKACHMVHGGENPKLMADKVPFGKWSLPIKFIKTESGGSCAPGCHQKYPYDRKDPGKDGNPVKTGEKDTSKNK